MTLNQKINIQLLVDQNGYKIKLLLSVIFVSVEIKTLSVYKIKENIFLNLYPIDQNTIHIEIEVLFNK